MLLGTLGAGLLGSLLTGKGKIRAGKGTVRAREETNGAGKKFKCRPILLLILKYQNMKINLNLMVFIQEIIRLK